LVDGFPGEKYFALLKNLINCPTESLEENDTPIAALASDVLSHSFFDDLVCIERGDILIFAPWLANIWDRILPSSSEYVRSRFYDRLDRLYGQLKVTVEKHIPLRNQRIRLRLDGKDFPKDSLIKREEIPQIAVYRELRSRGMKGKELFDTIALIFPFYGESDDRMRKKFERLEAHAKEQGISVLEEDLPQEFEERYAKAIANRGRGK